MSQTQPKHSDLLAKAAQSLVGTAYQHQGRTKAGVDCVGLVVVAAQSVGVDLSEHDDTRYGPRPDAAALRERLDTAFEPTATISPGTIVLMKTAELGAVHLGVIAERNNTLTLVHAVNSRGCVVEHRLDSHIRASIEQSYTLKDQA